MVSDDAEGEEESRVFRQQGVQAELALQWTLSCKRLWESHGTAAPIEVRCQTPVCGHLLKNCLCPGSETLLTHRMRKTATLYIQHTTELSLECIQRSRDKEGALWTSVFLGNATTFTNTHLAPAQYWSNTVPLPGPGQKPRVVRTEYAPGMMNPEPAEVQRSRRKVRNTIRGKGSPSICENGGVQGFRQWAALGHMGTWWGCFSRTGWVKDRSGSTPVQVSLAVPGRTPALEDIATNSPKELIVHLALSLSWKSQEMVQNSWTI